MIPIAVSTYAVQRASNIDGDSQEPLNWETVMSGIPGCPSFYSGSESVAKGSRERVDARLFLDTLEDIHHYDRVVDESTGDVWAISYCRKRLGLGLDHTLIGVYEVTGVAQGTRDL